MNNVCRDKQFYTDTASKKNVTVLYILLNANIIIVFDLIVVQVVIILP